MIDSLSRKVGLLLLLLAGAGMTYCAVAEVEQIVLPQIRYRTMETGLDYAHVSQTNQPWSIHIARLYRKQEQLEVVTTLGTGRIQGLAALSKQVADFPTALGRPLAAINGDFFHIKPGSYQGDPDGLQIVEGELISAPMDKCFWVDTKKNFHIGVVRSRHNVAWPSGTRTTMELNQTPRTNAATLFTPTFGRSTEATNLAELVLESANSKPWLPLRINATYRARVLAVRPEGNTTLTSNRLVLTVSGSATTNLATIKPGDILRLSTSTSADISKATTAIGGGPILVHNGKVQPWPARTKAVDYLQPRHPRTAIGFNKLYLYLVAVDGRQKELSIGMSFVELAALMKQIGCTEALNLDGGGSTTFWLDGKVMNSPSDKHERSLANAVMIVQKAK